MFCTISGYGMTGPYANLPSHGIAYDTWAGLVNPTYNEEGFPYLPEHASVGIHAGPLFGAFGLAQQRTSVTLLSKAAVELGVPGKLVSVVAA